MYTKRIIKEWDIQLYVHQFEILDKMIQLFETRYFSNLM